MSKKVLLVLIIAVLVMTISFAFSDDAIRVQLNGNYIDFTDAEGNRVDPQLINNRTMVPLRKIFEAFNCQIDWNQDTKTVTAQKDDKEIILTIDNEVAKVRESGDEREIVLDSAPVIVDNRTLVPVRFIAESLEKDVSWVQDRKIVVVLDNDKILEEFQRRVPSLQLLFDLKLNEVKSFKSSSKITGSFVYNDSEDKDKYEEIKLKGNLDIALSGQDFQIDAELNFSGKDGTILNSIKEAGYEKIKIRFVSKDGNMYLGTYNGKSYDWQSLGNYNDSLEQVSAAYPGFTGNITDLTVDGYDSMLALIMQMVGEKNENTYDALMDAFDIMGKIFNENLTYTGNDENGKLTFDIDFGKVLSNIMPEAQESIVSALDLRLYSTLSIVNSLVSGEDVNLDFEFKSPESSESFTISAQIATNYKDINKEIKIDTPNV